MRRFDVGPAVVPPSSRERHAAPRLAGVLLGVLCSSALLGCSDGETQSGAGLAFDEAVSDATQEIVVPGCVSIVRGSGTVADATIAFDPADPTRAIANIGGTNLMAVGALGGATRESLLSFGLVGKVPATAVVTSATLTLTKGTHVGPGSVLVHRATAPWSEASVTWSSFGQQFDATVEATLDSTVFGPQSVDVTALVKAWQAGTVPNEGFLLEQVAGTGRTTFGTSEAVTPANRPQLTVCYGPATCSDGLQNQGEGGVDCGGPCANACPTCSDGVQNQGETGIDCGGPCAACALPPSLTRWTDGSAQWPDQACNSTNSFGYCDTNAQNHADAWATAVCQLNGYASGVWTGNKLAGCSGSTSAWCAGTIPCTLNYEYVCAQSDQTQIEITCYSSAASWPRVYGAVNTNIGSYSTVGTAIATTAAGDVVVSGCNGSPGADFGGGPEAIVNSGENDIFAARYTGSNNFISYGAGYLVPGGYGGPNPPYSYNCGTGLALDSAGVAYVVGYGQDPIVEAQGIVKIDAAGNWLGNIAFPAGSYTQGQAILLDPSDDIFYASQVVTVIYSPVFSVTYNLDLNKLSPAGASLWSSNVASVTAAYPSLVTPSGRLAQDAAGNTFGAAYFAGSINTPSGVVVAAGANDLLLYKVSPAGAVLWVKTLGSTADDIAMDVASDGSGGIWVAGHFGATLTAGAYTLTNGGGKDVFLLHLDASGNVLSASRFGTSGDDAATSLAIDSAGTLHVVGTAALSGLDLGGGPLGGTGAFLALFSSAGAHLSSQLVPNSVATFTLQYNVDPSVPRVAIAAGNASAVSYVNPMKVPEVTVLP